MKQLPRLFVAVAVVATALTFASTQPAHASCVVFNQTNTTGSTISFEFNANGDAITYISTGGDNETDHYPAGEYTGPVEVEVFPYSTAIILDEGPHCAGPVTFFNPGDGRLNGQPGDRLVVYCNASATSPNIDVWVIDNGGSGHELSKLALSDLTSVAAGKFSKNLGANGVLFAGSDASGNGYAALQGGPYGGTATGDWLKTFSCKAS